jgi:hypothetical protein
MNNGNIFKDSGIGFYRFETVPGEGQSLSTLAPESDSK